MSVRSMISASCRNALVAAFSSLALIAASASPSVAASTRAPPAKAAVAGQTASDATDFSAAKRRHYRRGSNAAGLAFMGLAAGLIGSAIAESRRQEYYENRYYYGPGSYYGGPGYYGGGPRYYYQPY
ncbi:MULTISPECIES: hypothetical protein [unclassified Bradyrhizobium]|uniref:hypothetical protein n=1 Tax=unclassified Bradyrhizobium TaxID=2631580 RepID=UPI001FF7DFFD|nr:MULTISPECIES: hypothetical protein [unclassified Bradyrhizobium]MCK1714665.1 hypothetical protein [Bradyrhizobium sp. 143]MCK1726183.1 hypothetical protein [Bradyrhizobium sp. 142]